MKNFDESIERIRSKAKKLKTRRRIIASCSAMLALTLLLTLFLPYNHELPSVKKYEKSPYYQLINGINMVTYQPPEYKNNYQWLKDALVGIGRGVMFAPTMDDAVPESMVATGAASPNYAPTYGSQLGTVNSDSSQEYEEVTDNQVQGVIESDIFKRSNQYIYYLRSNELSVYSIAQEASQKVGIFTLPTIDAYYYNFEMFLSADCNTVTVISSQSTRAYGACIVVYSLDVSDPTSIVLVGQQCFMGSYISSRMVDGDLLLIYNYAISGEMDFDKPETFVPTYGEWDNMKPMDAEDIYCPVEAPASARYTVIAKMDGEVLEVMDCAALLSYSQQVYVSEDTVYATYGCVQRTEQGSSILSSTVTEITGISYRGESLDVLGTVTVNGGIKNQYSMDQYRGILRVATSTVEQERQEHISENYGWVQIGSSKRNCDLYCIDLSTWKIAASVIAFAPEGEEVTSARFDGPNAYICTAEVVIMSDPVYYFDLSDINNITYKHTPVIDGYSSSLVNFGEYLLGIGYNEQRMLKLEVYMETDTGIEPITAYECDAWFSESYKSYFIDREENLVGLAIGTYQGNNDYAYYLLLHFDGYQLQQVAKLPIYDVYVETCRADVIDGWLYLLESDLQVCRIYG